MYLVRPAADDFLLFCCCCDFSPGPSPAIVHWFGPSYRLLWRRSCSHVAYPPPSPPSSQAPIFLTFPIT